MSVKRYSKRKTLKTKRNNFRRWKITDKKKKQIIERIKKYDTIGLKPNKKNKIEKEKALKILIKKQEKVLPIVLKALEKTTKAEQVNLHYAWYVFFKWYPGNQPLPQGYIQPYQVDTFIKIIKNKKKLYLWKNTLIKLCDDLNIFGKKSIPRIDNNGIKDSLYFWKLYMEMKRYNINMFDNDEGLGIPWFWYVLDTLTKFY